MRAIILVLALAACGRGGGCPPTKHPAINDSGKTSQPCEVRK